MYEKIEQRVEDDFLKFGVAETIRDILKDYIIDNTIKGKYEGELCYLQQYQRLDRYFKNMRHDNG
jgi:hypothetical protein